MLHSQPSQEFDADAVSRELRSNVTSASSKLQQLHAQNLIRITNDDKYIYSPPPTLVKVIDDLHDLYQIRPVAIVSFIYEKPVDKLKGFADAFKLKKD
ncbi:MAG TPA: hypothetical protein VNJ01_00620 [Bacteriovoracaceae bacterium]|nr:hypothetical protein [Bacteriovoracaceae bacterium]